MPYRGRNTDAPLDSWVEVSSSWLQAGYYLFASKVLILRTKEGGEYSFLGVPLSKWEGFLAAPSKGRYYHAFIAGKYRDGGRSGTGRYIRAPKKYRPPKGVKKASGRRR